MKKIKIKLNNTKLNVVLSPPFNIGKIDVNIIENNTNNNPDTVALFRNMLYNH